MGTIRIAAARALRAAADRLDPQPPHMREALNLLGWAWDGAHWVYRYRWTGPNTNTTSTVRWYHGNVGGEDA